MANTSSPLPRPQQIRRDTGIFYFPIKNGGSWPIAEKEMLPVTKTNGHAQPGVTLKHSATMPTLSRTPTDGTTTSKQFIKIQASPESASNGASRSRSFMAIFTNIPGLGSLTVNFPTIGLPPLVYPALRLGMPTVEAPPWLPDIEVKSKHKKGPFGRKWKQMRAVLDTGCTAGNWVSLDTLDDLGIKEYNKLPLTDVENIGAQTVGGVTVKASGAVNLTWHGVPGQNVQYNCSRNFKMRFLVLDSEPAPFQILIGSESIWKCGILGAPMFMANRDGEIVGLPPKPKAKVDKKPTHEERRAENERKKNARKAAIQQQNVADAASPANGNVANRMKQAPNGPSLPHAGGNLSNESLKSHNQETLDRDQTLTSESKKAAKESAKASPSKSPSTKVR